jgi:hypothetical protein
MTISDNLAPHTVILYQHYMFIKGKSIRVLPPSAKRQENIEDLRLKRKPNNE